MKQILVVEDEQSIAHTITHSIEREGFAAVWRERGLDALQLLEQGGFALVVLDVGLPDVSGFELCKSIRAFSEVPIIFLTARDEEIDKIVGLEIGADDYVTKPFSPRELAARVKSVLRRAESRRADSTVSTVAAANAVATGAVNAAVADTPSPAAAPRGQVQASYPGARPQSGEASVSSRTGVYFPAGGSGQETEIFIKTASLCIDASKMQASYLGARLELTRYEFYLLALLAAAPGRVYSRGQIMRRVWGEDSPSLDRTVDAHIKSLRAKFRELNCEADPIVTHRGTGYALRDDA